jgi:hypothetical protein
MAKFNTRDLSPDAVIEPSLRNDDDDDVLMRVIIQFLEEQL